MVCPPDTSIRWAVTQRLSSRSRLAIIGQIGYGRASSLTAVGDTINAASRLEGFAKEYDAQLAVSADVVRYADAKRGQRRAGRQRKPSLLFHASSSS